jgi:hypothetical protein
LIQVCYLTAQNMTAAMVSFEEGESLARKALDIIESVFDADHINIGSSLTDLAKVLHIAGKLEEETKQLYKRSLSIYLKCEGADGLLVMEANANLGTFYADRGELASLEVVKKVEFLFSQVYYKEAIRISALVNGLNHPNTEEYSSKGVTVNDKLRNF